MSRSIKDYPFTDLTLAPAAVDVEEQDGGSVLLRNPAPLASYPRQLGEVLRRRADLHPDRSFLVERDADFEWRHLTYGEARAKVDAVSQWLLDNGHTPDNPICVLSDNSVNFGILQLAAMQVGIPFMPVSPAYSLMSQDYAKVRFAFEKFTPTLVYVEALAPFAKALQAVNDAGIPVVAGQSNGEIPGVLPFAELTRTGPEPRSRRPSAASTAIRSPRSC